MATVAGLFPDRDSAEKAIHALQAAGFNPDRIGIVMRDRRETREAADEAGVNATAGAVAGSAIGGTLGAILAATGALVIPGIGPFVSGGILATALVGGVAGWLVGGLVALGIPHKEAEYYQGQVEQGRVLVTVEAGDSVDRARATLLRSGAENLRESGSMNVGDTSGDTASLERPLDVSNDVRAANPSGIPAQALPNEQPAATQQSAASTEPAEGEAPHQRVILPPGFVTEPHAAQNYGVADAPAEPPQGANTRLEGSSTSTTNDTVPSRDVNSGLIGSSAPPNDAIPMAGQSMPRPDESAINPADAQDGSDDEPRIVRDEDIIRQEQQRME